MDKISFSIVVATKGRVALLLDLIKSIQAARENYGGECEVLIVDDSSPEERLQIQDACRDYGCTYLFFENAVSAKRNHGARKAKNEVILFLDSDCIATEHILERYAEKYDDRRVAAVAGPLEFVGPDTWFWKAIEATPYLTCFYLPRYVPKLEWGVTANFSVKRQVFLEVGGFDEGFRRPAGEDVDLGLLIREAGYEINGAPEALVYHSKKTWIPFRSMIRRLKFYGTADCDLIAKHPDRGEVVLPKRAHMYAVYAALLFAAALISRKWLLLLGIPGIILLENVAVSLLVNRLSHEKKASFSQQMMAQLLIHDSESAYLRRCLRTGNLAAIRKQMIYYLGQYNGMLHIGSYNIWVTYGCLALIALLVLCFV